jgi:hypothetical protein
MVEASFDNVSRCLEDIFDKAVVYRHYITCKDQTSNTVLRHVLPIGQGVLKFIWPRPNTNMLQDSIVNI